jgi:hypothetical protein
MTETRMADRADVLHDLDVAMDSGAFDPETLVDIDLDVVRARAGELAEWFVERYEVRRRIDPGDPV